MSAEQFTEIRHPLQARPRGERVVIVGTGETAAVALEYFRHDTPHEVVAFCAETPFIEADSYYGLPLVPLEGLADAYPAAGHRVFVAVALVQLNRVRRRLYRAVKAAGFGCVSYVSSHAVVTPNVTIGENSFVQEHVALQYGARVGDNVFLGSGTCVGYRSVVEDDCYAGPHVTVGDFCRIGRASFLGANSCVAEGRLVAEDCIVGAGTAILKDTMTRQVYLGNPARCLGRDSFETFGVTDG
jgi:sugar O-acyltransferase (sialic acid O-acetyltransferase NeuD family)